MNVDAGTLTAELFGLSADMDYTYEAHSTAQCGGRGFGRVSFTTFNLIVRNLYSSGGNFRRCIFS